MKTYGALLLLLEEDDKVAAYLDEMASMSTFEGNTGARREGAGGGDIGELMEFLRLLLLDPDSIERPNCCFLADIFKKMLRKAMTGASISVGVKQMGQRSLWACTCVRKSFSDMIQPQMSMTVSGQGRVRD